MRETTLFTANVKTAKNDLIIILRIFLAYSNYMVLGSNHRNHMILTFIVLQGRLDVSLFIYFLSAGAVELSRYCTTLACYYSIVPCISKGDISASAICHLWRFILIDWCIGRSS